MYVILEASHRSEDEAVTEIWTVIRRTYETHADLRTSVHRQDVRFSARITANAWQKYTAYLQKKDPSGHQKSSQWILDLYQTFGLPQPNVPSGAANTEVDGDPEQPFDFDFDLDMVDWSAWDKAYLDTGLFTGPV